MLPKCSSLNTFKKLIFKFPNLIKIIDRNIEKSSQNFFAEVFSPKFFCSFFGRFFTAGFCFIFYTRAGSRSVSKSMMEMTEIVQLFKKFHYLLLYKMKFVKSALPQKACSTPGSASVSYFVYCNCKLLFECWSFLLIIPIFTPYSPSLFTPLCQCSDT